MHAIDCFRADRDARLEQMSIAELSAEIESLEARRDAAGVAIQNHIQHGVLHLEYVLGGLRDLHQYAETLRVYAVSTSFRFHSAPSSANTY